MGHSDWTRCWACRVVSNTLSGSGICSVDQNERAVKTSFGKAERVGSTTTIHNPIAKTLNADKAEGRLSYTRA